MPHYYSLGSIPHKRHTQFLNQTGLFTASNFLVQKDFQITIPYCIMYIHQQLLLDLKNQQI